MALRLQSVLTTLAGNSEWLILMPALALGFVSVILWPHDMRPFYVVTGAGVAGYLGIALWDVLRDFRDWGKPVNYKTLEVSDEGLRYEGRLSIDNFSVKWADVAEVSFVREETLWRDLFDPAYQTSWTIRTHGGEKLEMVDESTNRKKLFMAFQQYLPGFDAAAAERAFKAKRECGEWTCFKAG